MKEYELSYGIGTIFGSAELKITTARKKAMSLMNKYADLQYVQIYSKEYVEGQQGIWRQVGKKKLVGVVKRAWNKPGYTWNEANDPKSQYLYKMQTYRIAKDGSIKKV